MPTPEEDTLALGVTSRSRRRRKQKVVSTADEKENVPTTREYVSQPRAKTKPKTAKTTTIKKTATSKRAASKISPTISSVGATATIPCAWKYTSYEPPEDTLRRFRAALDSIPVDEVKEWWTD